MRSSSLLIAIVAIIAMASFADAVSLKSMRARSEQKAAVDAKAWIPCAGLATDVCSSTQGCTWIALGSGGRCVGSHDDETSAMAKVEPNCGTIVTQGSCTKTHGCFWYWTHCGTSTQNGLLEKDDGGAKAGGLAKVEATTINECGNQGWGKWDCVNSGHGCTWRNGQCNGIWFSLAKVQGSGGSKEGGLAKTEWGCAEFTGHQIKCVDAGCSWANSWQCLGVPTGQTHL